MNPSKVSEIFISYSRQDKDFVNKIAYFFKNNGLNCWVDETAITGSDDYLKAIADAIIAAKVMIVVLSNDTNKSGFVKNEIRLAVESKLKIIVFKVEKNASMEGLELFLGLSQKINAFEGDFDEKLEKLYNDCCELMQMAPTDIVQKKQRLFSRSFSFKGRIGRLEYDLSLLMYFGFAVGWTQWAKYKYEHFNLRITLLDTILYFAVLIITNWFMIAQVIKRSHDISKSAWYVINPLFIVVLPFQKGVLNKNLYGYSPKSAVIFTDGRDLKNYYALATSLLCFVIFLFSPKTDSYSYTTSPAKKGFLRYENFDFSIQYPSNWGVDVTGKSGDDFIAFSPMGPQIRLYQENISVATEDLTGKGIDLKTYVVIVLHRNHNHGGVTNTKVLDTASVQNSLNKMKCYKVLSTYEIKSSQVTEETNVFLANNMALAVMFTYSSDISDKNKALGREALQSFIIKNNQ